MSLPLLAPVASSPRLPRRRVSPPPVVELSPPRSAAILRRKPDADLAALAGRGSDAAFAAVVLRYRTALQRYCATFLSPERAEDAVQQTFVRALRSLRNGAEVHDLRPWLYRIARNVSLNELAARGWDYAELDDRASGSDLVCDVELRAKARETLSAVAALPQRQRTALIRCALQGERPAGVARELGITENALRQLVHRARVSVRSAVAAVFPAPVLHLLRRGAAVAGRVSPQTAVPFAPKVAAAVAVIAAAAPLPVVATLRHGSSAGAHPAPARSTDGATSSLSPSGHAPGPVTAAGAGATGPAPATFSAGASGTRSHASPPATGPEPVASPPSGTESSGAEAAPAESTGDPTASGGDPTASPADPTASPADPTASPADPTASPADPTASPADPTASPTDPTASPADPTSSPADPTSSPADPTAPAGDPATVSGPEPVSGASDAAAGPSTS